MKTNPTATGGHAWFDELLEEALDRFDTAWQFGPPPDIANFLGHLTGERRLELLRELVMIDLEKRWRLFDPSAAGESPLLLEDYQQRFPELEISLQMVMEEWRARMRGGVQCAVEDYRGRFPQFGQSLEEVLSALAISDVKPLDNPQSEKATLLLDQTVAVKSGDLTADIPQKIGRYAVHARLGAGAMGAVYRSYDPQLDRFVAIKVPSTESIGGASRLAAFLREARLAATLRHPAVVSIYDVICDADICYIVMECVEGRTLSDVLKSGQMSREDALGILAELAEALHEAHKLGLVHRDIKPANILVDRSDKPRILDFGLAIRDIDTGRRGEMAGTPLYMSPEQVRGDSHLLDGRSDLWSLGVILYEVVTGKRPFLAKWPELKEDILHREPKPPRMIDDSISPALERICLRCLSKDLTRRYTNGKDLSDDLRRFLRGIATTAPHWPEYHSPPTAPGRASKLPAEEGAFLGRDAEVEALLPLLQAQAPSSLTLTGPPGVGKSRLALRLAAAASGAWDGRCWFVDVASARSAQDVATAVLKALEIPIPAAGNVDAFVGELLQYHPPSLLVLDGFERAQSCARETVGAWRAVAPQITILVTSRIRLGVAGERAVEVEPLHVPHAKAGENAIAGSDAVQLFIRRAQEREARYFPSGADLLAIREICACLDGIPLAIELAAARISVLKPAQILARLNQKFQLLSSPDRNLPPRQRTLAGAIDSSLDMLDAVEKAVLLQLSVIEHGFFLAAAEAIVRLPAAPVEPLLVDVLQSLREQCLLRAADQGDEIRFSMYHPVREYAAQLWRQNCPPAEQQEFLGRVAEYFLEYGETWSARIGTPAASQAMKCLGVELDNLLAARQWAITAGQSETAARIAIAAADVLAVRAPVADRIGCLETSLRGASPASRMNLLLALSDAQAASGALAPAKQSADEAAQLAAQLQAPKGAAAALYQQADLTRLGGDHPQARRLFEQCEHACVAANDPRRLGMTLDRLGLLQWQLGEFDEAVQTYTRAAAVAQTAGDDATGVRIARHHGHLLMQRGDYEGALALFQRARDVAREMGDRRSLHQALASRGNALAEQGQFDAALDCYAQAESIARELGEPRAIAVNIGNRGLAFADRGDYAAALECFAAAEALNRSIGAAAGVAVNCGNRGAALAALGRFEEALAALEQAEELNRKLGNQAQLSFNQCDRAFVLGKLGRVDLARTLVESTIAILENLGMQKSVDFFCAKATAALIEEKAENIANARKFADEAMQLADQRGITADHRRKFVRDLRAELARLTSPKIAPPAAGG